ncbi:MAG TPA: VOC family protein [Phycisphaerae bacterium]
MFRSMIPTVFVSDFERSVRFYSEMVGLKLTSHKPGEWAEVSDGHGGVIGLHPAGGHNRHPALTATIHIGLRVTEPLDDVVQTLKQRGVIFRGPVVEDGDSRLAFFGDPDGNDLYLSEPKASVPAEVTPARKRPTRATHVRTPTGKRVPIPHA